MTTDDIFFMGVTITIIVLLYYFFPFISGIIISYYYRTKGRRIGAANKEAILRYVDAEAKSNVGQENNPGSEKKRLDGIRNMVNNIITDQMQAIEIKYNPALIELQAKIDKIDQLKENQKQRIKEPILIANIQSRSKNLLDNSVANQDFLEVTFLVWTVMFLLVLDTMVSREWIEQIGIFDKEEKIFGQDPSKNSKFINLINFSINSIVGFILNSGLLIVAHVMFKNMNLPSFFRHWAFKISLGILIFGGLIYLRFELPNSNDSIKGIMLTVIWLVLFLASYLLLHNAFRKLQNGRRMINNFLFFLVIPLAAVGLFTGGVTTMVVGIIEALISAGYEIRKARIERNKRNAEEKKNNLGDGFQEGITDIEKP